MTLQLPDVEWVAVDTECSGLFADDGARVACVALAWPERNGGDEAGIRTLALPFDQGIRDKLPAQMDMFEQEDPNLPREDWEQLLAWLSRQRLVFHNAKYDMQMLRVGTRVWEGCDLQSALYWDTMIAAGVLDPVEARGLDEVGRRLGLGRKRGLEAVGGWLAKRKLPKRRYDLVPWDIIEPYVVGDAELTARVYLWQSQRVNGAMAQLQGELALLRTLYVMEARGLRYDHQASLRIAQSLDERADRLERELPFRPTPNGAKKYFFGAKGLEPLRVTDKGAPSLDEETLREWVKLGVEWAAEYAEAKKIRTTVSMHFRGYAEKMGPDNRLRASYKQGHVRSGRMSVERVQLQALPKADKDLEGVPGVRQLLRADPGNGLWSLDFSQAELRVAAKYSGCRRMLAMLAEGVDVHGATCEDVIGVGRGDPLWKEKRDIAKRLNFGAIFQIGAEKFQATLKKLADVDLPLRECERLVRSWRSMYPEFGQAYRRAERTVKDRGYVRLLPNTEYEVRSLFGPRDWPHTGWNRIVQGSLAEFFKLFLVGVERRWPGRMILSIHDSIVLEMPTHEGDRVASEVQAYGAELATRLFRTEMKVDADRWYAGEASADEEAGHV